MTPAPRRILILAPYSTLGGAERNIALMARHLDMRRYEVLLITCGGTGDLARACRNAGWRTEEYPVFAHPPAFFNMRAAVRRFRPDLIHSFLLRGNWLAGLLVRLLPSVPWLAAERSCDLVRPAWRAALNRRLLARAHAVLAVSAPVREILMRRDRIPAEKIRIVPGGVEAAAPPLPLPKAIAALPRPRLICLGQLRREKNQALALRTLAHLRDQGSPASLSFFGDGPERRGLETLARELELADRVHFAGSHPEARRFLRHFDLMILPSSEEAFPNVILEAWQTDLPVVTTDTAGARAMDGGSDAVELAAENDLPGAVVRLLADSARQETLRRNGAARVRDFAVERALDQITRTWEEAITAPDAPR